MQRAARSGVVEASFALAVCLRNGIGCEKDPKAALEQFYRAALLGSTDAMAELAKIYYAGKIVTKNLERAKIFIDSANQEIDPIFYYGPGQYDEQVAAILKPKTKK